MNESLINQLQRAIGPKRVLLGGEVTERYEHIWRMQEPLKAMAVVLPSSTAEVAAILKACHAYHQPVVVHGGLTGLVGGTATNPEEIVISLEKLNKIEEIDASSRTMTVQAGVILEHIQQAAKEQKLLFPLNFGAKGTAQIGGAIATNAGGLRVFRFGMTRNLLLGLEVVLADGTILSSLKKIIKDNSAYDLKQLFIGSEGTLGIVTKAVLRLVEAPKSRNSAWVGVASYSKVIALLKYVDRRFSGTLSAFELVWNNSFQALTTPPTASVKSPLSYEYPFYVLIETLGSDQPKDLEKMQQVLADALEASLIEDAAIAFTQSDLDWFWTIREDVKVLMDVCKIGQLFDVSIPIPAIGNYVADTTNRLLEVAGVQGVFALGHLADGNIHFLIGKTNETAALTKTINDIIYAPLKALGGSISAEHGIGVEKKAYLSISSTPEEIALMRLLKKTLDPKNILNRGKVFEV